MKIKFLPIIALSIGLASCGDATEESNIEENNEDVVSNEVTDSKSNNMLENTTADLDVVSFVHGVSFASQIKQQQLTFINPDDLIKSFADYRANGLGDFNPKISVTELREIAGRTENFKTVAGVDLVKVQNIFSKLFFSDIKTSPLANHMNSSKFEEGMLDFWTNETMPSEDSIKVYSEFVSNIQSKEGRVFLAENGEKEGIITTASGLQYEIITEGSGAKPTDTSTVLAHYEGSLLNGNVFDSSYKRGEPSEFPLNKVIPGWTEGLQLMSPGAKFKFYIPFELGYGERGAGQDIPPFAALIFVVELVEVK